MSVTTTKALPRANGDFYAISSILGEEDSALLRKVRNFLEVDDGISACRWLPYIDVYTMSF
ncbi:MAG TPA: hypothetical protein VGT44_08065 [Ktedonobacteraceae bacterium]|nr:hypothetical protein [Ktedonobacteraceae bacterium]